MRDGRRAAVVALFVPDGAGAPLRQNALEILLGPWPIAVSKLPVAAIEWINSDFQGFYQI
jgi:hypothetical protein